MRNPDAERIYLDHAATTPIRAEVRLAMEPYLSDAYGNPSSLHSEGQKSKRALDAARDILAESLGCQFAEVTFTSGGTEANNAALLGVMLANRLRGDHLITTQIEHEAIGNTAHFLQTLGCRVTFLPVDSFGQVSPQSVAEAITPQTVLVSVIHASNEVGTIQPLREITEIVHARGAWLHSDAVQTFGQLPVSVEALGVDLLTVSAHKIYGPKGVGTLYVRSGISFEPLLHGGGQERGRRSGTENVAAIAGFGEAVRLMLPERDAEAVRLTALRDDLLSKLWQRIPEIVLNGHPTERLPNNLNVSFPGLDAETLLLSLDRAGVSASSGSACASGSIEPSHVLMAMGLPEEDIKSAIRLTLGRSTTSEEIDRLVEILGEIVAKMLRKDCLARR